MIQLLSTPAYTPPYLTHQKTAMLVQVLSPTTVFVLPFPTSLSEEASLGLHIYLPLTLSLNYVFTMLWSLSTRA